jgi:hypothetical protein
MRRTVWARDAARCAFAGTHGGAPADPRTLMLYDADWRCFRRRR